MEEFSLLRVRAKEAKRRRVQQDNVKAYFQVIYKHIFKSGRRILGMSDFMNQISKESGLQNKVLVSQTNADLALDDTQGRVIVTMDDQLTNMDFLFQEDFHETEEEGKLKKSLVIRLNANYPAPQGAWFTPTDDKKTYYIDLTKYDTNEVTRAVEHLARVGELLNEHGDTLMTRAEFKQQV